MAVAASGGLVSLKRKEVALNYGQFVQVHEKVKSLQTTIAFLAESKKENGAATHDAAIEVLGKAIVGLADSVGEPAKKKRKAAKGKAKAKPKLTKAGVPAKKPGRKPRAVEPATAAT